MVHFDGNDTYIHYITCYCVRVSAGVQDFVKGAWGETRFEDAVGSELTGWRRSKPQWGAGRNRGRQDILLLQQKGGGQMRVQGGTLTYFFRSGSRGSTCPLCPLPLAAPARLCPPTLAVDAVSLVARVAVTLVPAGQRAACSVRVTWSGREVAHLDHCAHKIVLAIPRASAVERGAI